MTTSPPQALDVASLRHHDELVTIASGSPWFMQALRHVAALGLAEWCIGAGAIRNLVWDHLHQHTQPSPLSDIDVAYFDAEENKPLRERELQAALSKAAPAFPWEVTNQAQVHLWFEDHFGHPVEPLRSLPEAVASWPEYATAVGLSMDAQGRLEVIAPWGLDDLFSMTVRRNPTRVSLATYHQRVAQKRYTERWPRVTVIV